MHKHMCFGSSWSAVVKVQTLAVIGRGAVCSAPIYV